MLLEMRHGILHRREGSAPNAIADLIKHALLDTTIRTPRDLCIAVAWMADIVNDGPPIRGDGS